MYTLHYNISVYHLNFTVITDNNGQKVLSHSPKDIIEQFLTNPSTFVNFLEENYLSHFSSINDVENAAASLSMADCVMAKWGVRRYQVFVHKNNTVEI